MSEFIRRRNSFFFFFHRGDFLHCKLWENKIYSVFGYFLYWHLLIVSSPMDLSSTYIWIRLHSFFNPNLYSQLLASLTFPFIANMHLKLNMSKTKLWFSLETYFSHSLSHFGTWTFLSFQFAQTGSISIICKFPLLFITHAEIIKKFHQFCFWYTSRILPLLSTSTTVI